jgi:hypothetical protein
MQINKGFLNINLFMPKYHLTKEGCLLRINAFSSITIGL